MITVVVELIQISDIIHSQSSQLTEVCEVSEDVIDTGAVTDDQVLDPGTNV